MHLLSTLDRLNDDEILDLLLKEDDSDEESHTDRRCAVGIAPPIEDANAMTDCDSDQSDDEVACDPDHLPRRILLTEVLTTEKDKDTEEEIVSEKETENESMTSKITNASRKKPLPIWKDSIPNKYANVVPDYTKCFSEDLEIIDPVQCLNKFWTEEKIGN